MTFGPYGRTPSTGVWIRDHLGIANRWRPDYIYHMYQLYRDERRAVGQHAPRPQSFTNYVYKLIELGLVVYDMVEVEGEMVEHTEPSSNPNLHDRVYVRLRDRKAATLADPRWLNPQKALNEEKGYDVRAYQPTGMPGGRPRK